jgi:hypothetical protein
VARDGSTARQSRRSDPRRTGNRLECGSARAYQRDVVIRDQPVQRRKTRLGCREERRRAAKIVAKLDEVRAHSGANDAANIVSRPAPSSAHGDLLVKLDSCKGPTLATIPLDAAIANPVLTTLSASWPAVAGAHDLCFEFAYRGNDPLWAIDEVQLLPTAR